MNDETTDPLTQSTGGEEDSPLVSAFKLADRFHRGQSRKGSSIPYITHVMAVAALTAEYGGSEEQIIAALLHDGIEDGGGHMAREMIYAAFGPVVTSLVEACTDTDQTPKPPWRARKERFIMSIRTMDPHARLIVAADKIHNVRSLLQDLEIYGDAVWDRFQGKKDGTLWYYRSVTEALRNVWTHPIVESLASDVAWLHERARRRP